MSFTEEIWRPIVGYPGYEVSNMGLVKSFRLRAAKFLKPNVVKSGYLHVAIGVTGKTFRTFRLHKLVAAAFLGPCPEGMQINHKNGVKGDNRVDNLEYVTVSENHKHAFRTGLKSHVGEKNPLSKLTELQAVEIYRLCWDSGCKQSEIAAQFGVSVPAVSLIKHGKCWAFATGHGKGGSPYPTRH